MKDGLTFEQWFVLNRYALEHRDMFATVWNAAIENAAMEVDYDADRASLERLKA